MSEQLAHTQIKPQTGWFDLDIKGLWRYRDLYKMYIKRDIVTVYKQTILGPLWYLIQPIFTTIMYMFIFGGLAGISTDGIPQPLFYLAGISLWGYFSTCFGACNCVFAVNAGVFGKVYFPRLVVPLAAITTTLIKMMIQLVVFVGVYLYYVFLKGEDLCPNWTLALFPIWVIMAGFMAFGLGLIVSSLTTKYRDLNFFVGFAVQLWMYGTPIIYPLSAAPEGYREFIELNPLTPIFEAFKHGLFGTGTIDMGGLAYSTVFLLVSLFFGVIIFSRIEKRFMDTV